MKYFLFLECFLQMKVPNSTRPTQYPHLKSCHCNCLTSGIFMRFGLNFTYSDISSTVFLNMMRFPFCKTSNYAVEYWGVKSEEEKGTEHVEEQRVIEAKIRMRQKEHQDEEERTLKRQYLSSSGQSMALGDMELSHAEGEEIVSDASCAPSSRSPVPPSRRNRPEEFGLDLEDIMAMEAIWLSIQERGKQSAPCYDSDSDLPEQRISSDDCYISPDNSLNMPPSCTSYYSSGGPSIGILHADGEWNLVHVTKTAEAGTSYRCSDSTDQDSEITNQPHQGVDVQDEGFQSLPASIVPESFEEQMMLAMEISLAEAQAMTQGPGITWHY
ncbi:hypothetical protein SAY86_028541 [Trapa natans]|uniref:Uncharacterized protein n=1 Tax=Trapa natans TaxID=22666 RepID=A0AAN7LZV8_TRANT|nr:hypothetical protein SAY86_028541 [Trapa natans]